MQLNVSHGAITEIDDTAFFNLRNLLILDSNLTKITSKILDDGLFINNINLKAVHLVDDDIRIICSNILTPQCKVMTAPSSCIPSVQPNYNRTVDTIYTNFNVKLDAIFQVEKLSQIIAENQKNCRKLSEDNPTYHVLRMMLSGKKGTN